MSRNDKPLVWLKGEVKSPALGTRAHRGRLSAQAPAARRAPFASTIQANELRIQDEGGTWRIVYRLDRDAIVIAEVFQKKTQATPRNVIENCKQRLRQYDELDHE